MSDLAALTHEDFAPHLGASFRLEAGDSVAFSVELSEVQARGAAAGSNDAEPTRQGFSLVFLAGADAQVLAQGVYRLEHPSLGAIEIFLVPIGPREGAMQYEAVFN